MTLFGLSMELCGRLRYGIVLLEVPYLISKAAGIGTGGVEVGEKSQHLLCLLSD